LEKNVKYVGLDISTSIIGVCFLDKNQDIILLDSINLKKIKCLFEKSNFVRKRFDLYKEEYSFEENMELSIEEAFQSFSKGFSSARTLSQLNRFNGIVSYLCCEVFNIKPVYINVNTARKNLQIKINKKLNKNTKEQVFEWVKNSIDDDFPWPIKTISRGVNKGVVKFDECCYDMSDAFVICKALLYYDKENS